jgi:hypothetical protein
MVKKNKHCLYITLQHQGELPGYHWALLLAPTPKTESANIRVRDSHLFHATNSVNPDHPQKPGSAAATWRYEDKPANSLSSGSMVVRILVAKFSSTVLVADLAKSIDMVVKSVRIVDDDANWTCWIWVEEALGALRALGDEYVVIPEVTNGGAVENRILEFGNEAMNKIRNLKKNIKHAKDLPHMDMRVR